MDRQHSSPPPDQTPAGEAVRGWFRSLRWRRGPAPALPPQLDPGEAIIISRSGHTEESWKALTNLERAEIRWRVGA